MQDTSSPIWLATALGLLLAGCIGGETEPEPIPPEPPPSWQNRIPTLTVASPGELAVGDNLTILGKDFIPADQGTATVLLEGTFFDDQGKAHPVDLQGKAIREGKRTDKLGWRLWPTILFHPTGDRLGYFVGDVRVVNEGRDGSQLVSDPLQVKLTVRPSLLPRLVRPASSSCQTLVSHTIENTGFVLAVEAVGLRAPTTDNPLTFYWTFLAEQWKVSMAYLNTDPTSLFPKAGGFVLEDVVSSGRLSTVQDQGSRSFLVKVASTVLGDARLKELKTAPVPAAGDGYRASVNVAVVDASGKSAKLAIPLDIARLVTMDYDGSTKLAERFQPQQVSDCIPPAAIGSQVTYSEDKSESRSRSMGFNINASVGVNFAPIPSNPFAFGINFSAGFGVEVGATVSSNKSVGLNLSGQILPGQVGTFYRQTAKVYRIGKLTGRNQCGQTVDLGEAILTDWLFTPELATGPSCVPPSRLPPAEKFLD